MPTSTLAYRIVSKVTRAAAPHISLGAYRRLMPRNPLGFFYHSVSDDDLPHIKHLYPYKSPAEFEQDILYLKGHYSLVGYPELLAHSRGERSLPPNAAFVSFDDGFAECYSVVRPILLEHNVPCLFFLATDWVANKGIYYRGKISLCIERFEQLDATEQKFALEKISNGFYEDANVDETDFQFSILDLRSLQQWNDPFLDQVCGILQINISEYLRTHQPFLTRAQISQMQSEDFTFGAHTRSHPKLGLIPQDQQAAEIIESCRIVCEITGHDQVPFAFPFSGSGVDRDFLASLRAQHRHVGLIFDTQKLHRDRPFILNRIWVDKPVPGVSSERNIEHWLHDAYVREVDM